MKTATINCKVCNKKVTLSGDIYQLECPYCHSLICNECGCMMEPIIENNGFDAPDPTHFETTGYKCTGCGLKI